MSESQSREETQTVKQYTSVVRQFAAEVVNDVKRFIRRILVGGGVCLFFTWPAIAVVSWPGAVSYTSLEHAETVDEARLALLAESVWIVTICGIESGKQYVEDRWKTAKNKVDK